MCFGKIKPIFGKKYLVEPAQPEYIRMGWGWLRVPRGGCACRAPRYSPDDPYYRLGPVHTSLCSSMSTGDWDLFVGPLEWARAETGRADRGLLYWRGFPMFYTVIK